MLPRGSEPHLSGTLRVEIFECTIQNDGSDYIAGVRAYLTTGNRKLNLKMGINTKCFLTDMRQWTIFLETLAGPP